MLRPCSCGKCQSQAKLTQRNGGWSVDCSNTDIFIVVENNSTLCDNVSYELFDTPNDAIIYWNIKQFLLS